jgi:hypothetical protein
MTSDKSNKLSVSVGNRSIWRHRLSEGQRFEKTFFYLLKKNFLYPSSWTQVQLNISSPSTIDTSRTATLIAFDGKLTNNAQIELENILIAHQPCPSSKNCFIK